MVLCACNTLISKEHIPTDFTLLKPSLSSRSTAKVVGAGIGTSLLTFAILNWFNANSNNKYIRIKTTGIALLYWPSLLVGIEMPIDIWTRHQTFNACVAFLAGAGMSWWVYTETPEGKFRHAEYAINKALCDG